MRSMKYGAAAALALAVSGCAFQKQAIVLQPKINVPASNVGNGRLTMVNVADERPRTTLGTRGVRGIGADLTIDGDLAAIVQTALSDGLKAQGFATEGPLESQLRVEIRNLDYIVNQGFWSGKLNVEFLLKGVCVKGERRPYEQTYRGEVRENIQVVQGEAANNAYVNAATSDAINKLLSDQQMLSCLAQA